MLRMGFFEKGQPYEEKELSIAIVGSRYPTTYGFEISKKVRKRAGSARRTDCKWTRKGHRWDGSP